MLQLFHGWRRLILVFFQALLSLSTPPFLHYRHRWCLPLRVLLRLVGSRHPPRNRTCRCLQEHHPPPTTHVDAKQAQLPLRRHRPETSLVLPPNLLQPHHPSRGSNLQNLSFSFKENMLLQINPQNMLLRHRRHHRTEGHEGNQSQNGEGGWFGHWIGRVWVRQRVWRVFEVV